MYARKIIRQQSYVVDENKDTVSEYLPDYQIVDINRIENEHARTVGAEDIFYYTIKELGLDKKLIELGFNKVQMEAAIRVITARLINLTSERATHLWLQKISGIDELMDTDFSTLFQDRVYKVSDMLLREKSERRILNLENA